MGTLVRRTDAQLCHDIRVELQCDARLPRGSVIVAHVRCGVVTLRGSVSTKAAGAAAEEAVYRVSGIRGVINELRVRLPIVAGT